MVKKLKQVVWSEMAIRQLSEIHTYIKKQSPVGAQKVVKEILKSTSKLGKTNKELRVDELKRKHDGSYRVLFVYHYRISFRVFTNQIYFLRIRHTSQEPFLH